MNTSSSLTPTRIALVEDDEDLRDTYTEFLQSLGYRVWGSASAEGFYKRLAVDPVDLVLLDIGLPGEDGISVATHLRNLPQVAVIIVSARDGVSERINGLKAGADRYLVKPVDLMELAANIEAVVRRPVTPEANPTGAAVGWHLDRKSWRLMAPDGQSFLATTREFAMLSCLFEAQGKTVTREVLAEKMFGFRATNSSERIAVVVGRLRKKSLAMLGQELPVKAIHSVGYATAVVTVIE